MPKQVDYSNLGFLPSPPDYRDITTGQIGKAVTIPSSYMTNIAQFPVWNQQKIGACVGHAGAKAQQVADKFETGEITPLSARFLYALCKAVDGYAGEGTYYRLAMKMLKDKGCATELTVPNDTSLPHEEYVYNRDMTKIPAEAFVEALPYSINSYAQVLPLSFDTLKQAIYQHKYVLLGMSLGKEWWTDVDGNSTWEEAKLMPLRPPAQVVSGHAVLAIGYDQNYIYFLNSWSGSWGRKGVGYFGKNYEPHLVESWVSVDLPNDWQKITDLPKELHHQFNTNLFYGSHILGSYYKEEIKLLQTALLIEGIFPKEYFTPDQLGYFGPKTLKAVKEFQIKYSISPVWGYVGPLTRAKLNELFA